MQAEGYSINVVNDNERLRWGDGFKLIVRWWSKRADNSRIRSIMSVAGWVYQDEGSRIRIDTTKWWYQVSVKEKR